MQGTLVPQRPQFNLRLDPRTATMLRLLQRHYNVSAASVMRIALAELIRANGLPMPEADTDDGDE